MAKVVLWGTLADLAGGSSELEFDAPTIRAVLNELSMRFPALKDQLETNISVSVNGQVYRDAWFVDLSDEDEVYILPKLQGG